MFHAANKVGLTALLVGALLLTGNAQAQDKRVRHVQDDAGLFSQEAKDQANRTIAQLFDKHHKELIIETVKSSPAMDKDAQTQWAKERFNNLKADGVYVVFSKDPKFFRIRVGNVTLKEHFTPANIKALEKVILAKQSADAMLTRMTDYVLETMDAQAPRKAVQQQNQGVVPVPVQQQQQPRGENVRNEAPAWLGWVCLIIGGLVVVWVIIAIIRAMTGMMSGGGAAPGYGGGYGGGGGGGFFTGMLGGLFGAMAGMWVYNTFFGGHANYHTGDWGGGGHQGGGWADKPGDGGKDFDGDKDAGGYSGDTDNDAGGGGGDWGGGGGDAGGGDAGGGDWGGGGGGDAGGGGDWGGGGGDAGGGGGCGGAGCGGGGGGD